MRPVTGHFVITLSDHTGHLKWLLSVTGAGRLLRVTTTFTQPSTARVAALTAFITNPVYADQPDGVNPVIPDH